MVKPRIIIADELENYIIPLQYRFIKEFFEKIDLEIITDKSYFSSFFSKPQKVDILIVSESLYDISLQRHDISHIFVMVETYEEGDTEGFNINKLYKYTSMKGIFNAIVTKSADVLNISGVDDKETKIVLVTSAVGGAGKTTISMGIATHLTKHFKRVLYINASRLQHFQYMLDDDTCLSASDAYMKFANPSEHIYEDVRHVIRNESFNYLPAFRTSLISMGVRYNIFEKFALSAKKSGDYDYIIIDAESTFDEDKTRLIDIADKVILVTEQSYSSGYATNTLVANINGTQSDKYIFICNRFDSKKYNVFSDIELPKKFTINEYVGHLVAGDIIKSSVLERNIELERVAFLVM